jgi:hypothetical protein
VVYATKLENPWPTSATASMENGNQNEKESKEADYDEDKGQLDLETTLQQSAFQECKRTAGKDNT